MKKLFFQLVFSTYHHVVLVKLKERKLIGWRIQFFTWRVSTQHTFGSPRSMKKEKYVKKCDLDVNIMFFNLLIFCEERATKGMPSGYLLYAKLNSPSKECSDLKLEKSHMEISWKYKKIYSFFSSKIWWGKLNSTNDQIWGVQIFCCKILVGMHERREGVLRLGLLVRLIVHLDACIC